MLKVFAFYLIAAFNVLLATNDFQPLQQFIVTNFRCGDIPTFFKYLEKPLERTTILGYFEHAFNDETEKELAWKSQKEAEKKIGYFTFLMNYAVISYREQHGYDDFLTDVTILYQNILKKIIGNSVSELKHMKEATCGVNSRQHFLWVTFNGELLTLPFVAQGGYYCGAKPIHFYAIKRSNQ